MALMRNKSVPQGSAAVPADPSGPQAQSAEGDAVVRSPDALETLPMPEPLDQDRLAGARRPFFRHDERKRMARAAFVSLLVHALLLTLMFSGDAAGPPGLTLPWRDRRAEVSDLQVVLAAGDAAAAQDAATVPPDLAATGAAGAMVVDRSVPAQASERNEASVPPAVEPAIPPEAVQAKAATGGTAVREAATLPAPVDAPAPSPNPAVIAAAPDVPVAPAVAPVVAPPVLEAQTSLVSVAPTASSPASGRPDLDQTLDAQQQEAAHAQAQRVEAARQEAERRELARQAAAQEEQVRIQEAERLEAARAQAARHEAGREAARQAAAQQDAQKQEEARQEAARAEAARQDAERREAARQAAAQQEERKQEEARQEAARAEAARQDAERREAARHAAAQQEVRKQEEARQEAARVEAARQDAERREAARQAAAQQEVRKQEEARQEAARAEAARQDAERREAARHAAAQQDARKQDEDREAKREALKRAIGRQLDEEADRREASAKAARPPNTLPLSLSSARRGRLWGRTDPNAELVEYAQAWARKIQLNTPYEVVRDIAARPHRVPMLTVAVRSDGSVESVNFVATTGVPEIDEAIRRIVDSQRPFAPFPPALAREYDVIEIRRIWYFDSAVRLE